MPGPDPDGSDDSKRSSDGSRVKSGLKSAGRSLSSSGQDMMDRAASERVAPVAYKRGGKVRKAKRKKMRRSSR
jgi:hypothetical protein